MQKTGRNDPCPCGSGKKFKKCHFGREDEIFSDGLAGFPEEMSKRITALSPVDHRRALEMVQALESERMAGSNVGLKFVSLKEYRELELFGHSLLGETTADSGGLLINPQKTAKSDPNHIYLAISDDADDGVLVHLLAHAMDHLCGSHLLPGLAKPLSLDLQIPVEHLEHPYEFGYWLTRLQEVFDVQLDADDSVIAYLYRNGMLIRGEEISGQNHVLLKTRSVGILRFLSEHSTEIDELICERKGYIGSRVRQE
jgi:SEC-C motif